jgi:hypothetical protein
MAVTLVVEDGSGLSNANAFASVVEITAILDENIYAKPAWSALAPAEQDAVAVRATALIVEDVAARGWRWCGWPINASQALPFPRIGLYDREGYPSPSSIVPSAIKRLAADICATLSTVDAAAAANGPAVQSVTMGRTSVTYAVSGGHVAPVIPHRLYASILHLVDRVVIAVRA